MMIDEMLKDNWVYQRMLEEGRKEGIERGREEGREEGRIAEARQNIELFVEKRFPSLLTWVQARVEQISEADTLQNIIVTLFTANTDEEITAAFPAQS